MSTTLDQILAALETLHAEKLQQDQWAAWHGERRNTESAAKHRATAAGMQRAISLLSAAMPAPDEAVPRGTASLFSEKSHSPT